MVIAIVGAVARRPRLWPAALGQWRRMVPTRWWRRWPFLPVPTTEYLTFRRLTQYGNTETSVSPADVVNYLAWCRSYRRGR